MLGELPAMLGYPPDPLAGAYVIVASALFFMVLPIFALSVGIGYKTELWERRNSFPFA